MVTVCFGDPWQSSMLKTCSWLLKFYGRSINLSECRILLSFLVVFKCPFLICLFQQWEKQKKWCDFERNLIFQSGDRILGMPVAHMCTHSPRPTCCCVGDCQQCIACQNFNFKELVLEDAWQPSVFTACSSMFCLLTWGIGCICFQKVLWMALNRISCTVSSLWRMC